MQDFDTQEKLLRNRLARFGEQQYQAPQGKMVGRHFVAPNALQHIAAGLRGYGGIQGVAQTEQELKDLTGKRQTAIADALRTYGDEMMGAPEQRAATQAEYFDEADRASLGGNQNLTAVTPARQANPMAAYQSLLSAPDASLRQAGFQGMAKIPEMQAQAEQRAAELAFRQEEAEANRQARVDQMNMQNEQRMEAMRQQQEFQRQMRSMGGGGASSQPFFQPVQTAQGVMAFNARTGRVEPVMGADGQPIVGAAADPTLQGQLAGAKTTATRQAESTADARGESRKADMFLKQLAQAEEILKAGPTASGVGAAVDATGRIFGVTTESAQRAAQLESLSGWLVANVPRMEGPQSNFDVQNYMTMAGKIGDRTVPVEERMAALQGVRQLQEKYKESADARSGRPPTTPPPNSRIRFDAQGNIIQ
jgi:hypothetical protein